MSNLLYFIFGIQISNRLQNTKVKCQKTPYYRLSLISASLLHFSKILLVLMSGIENVYFLTKNSPLNTLCIPQPYAHPLYFRPVTTPTPLAYSSLKSCLVFFGQKTLSQTSQYFSIHGKDVKLCSRNFKLYHIVSKRVVQSLTN